MRKSKGFTMVELLAVLVILGIIAMIAVPAISKMISKTDKEYYPSLEGTVVSYGQEYFNDRRVLLPKEIGNIKEVTIPLLVKEKYGDQPKDMKNEDCNGRVIVQKKSTGKYEYTTCLVCPEYKTSSSVCGYTEEGNDKVVISGVKNTIVKQGSNYSLPKGKATINGEVIAEVNPSPERIDSDQLTSYDVYYTYKTVAKSVKYTVTDQTSPAKPSVDLKLANGSRYNQSWTNQSITQTITSSDWTKSGVMGSGMKGFLISTDNQATWKEQGSPIGTLTLTQTEAINNTIYVKAIDQAGNQSEVVSYKLMIDKVGPSDFALQSITSTNANYNALTTVIKSKATSPSGGLKMCISTTGYENGCSYETYNGSKNYTISGSLDGVTRTIYMSVIDAAGNKKQGSMTYTPYKECSQTTTSYGSYGSCNKTCGGGTQSRTNTVKDNKTGKVCSNPVESQACNTQACCSSTVDYQWDGWGSCNKTCGGGTQYRNIHRKSTYDGSYCGYYQQSQSCNTQSCFNPDNSIDYISCPNLTVALSNPVSANEILNNSTRLGYIAEHQESMACVTSNAYLLSLLTKNANARVVLQNSKFLQENYQNVVNSCWNGGYFQTTNYTDAYSTSSKSSDSMAYANVSYPTGTADRPIKKGTTLENQQCITINQTAKLQGGLSSKSNQVVYKTATFKGCPYNKCGYGVSEYISSTQGYTMARYVGFGGLEMTPWRWELSSTYGAWFQGIVCIPK